MIYLNMASIPVFCVDLTRQISYETTPQNVMLIYKIKLLIHYDTF